MESSLRRTRKQRAKRALRVRKKLNGTAEKPRLSVFKSNRNLFVQLIDDEKGETLFGVGTLGKELKDTKLAQKSTDAAKHLGNLVAQKAKEKNITKAVFDRGRYKYHGLIAALAEAAREAGLQI